MNRIKRVLKKILPAYFVNYLQNKRLKAFSQKSTEEVFTAIYMNKLWGKGEDKFYSGDGSDLEKSQVYIDTVVSFIKANDIKSLTDIGCGDFRVANSIVHKLNNNLFYTGIDVVKPLIDYNQAKFGSSTVRFINMDVIVEEPIVSELCTIREVLQHLSNQQIATILSKLKKYKYVIITERQAVPSIEVNKDKLQGPHTRVMYHSGIFLEHDPFNLKVDILSEFEAEDYDRFGKKMQTVLKTYLINNEI